MPSPTSLSKASLLRLGRHEQDNLFSAVELLNAPVSEKEIPLDLSTVFLEDGLLRPVTITVRGRLYCGVPIQGEESILDIAPRRYTAVAQTDTEVLPEPPCRSPLAGQQDNPVLSRVPTIYSSVKAWIAVPIPFASLPRLHRYTRRKRKLATQPASLSKFASTDCT